MRRSSSRSSAPRRKLVELNNFGHYQNEDKKAEELKRITRIVGRHSDCSSQELPAEIARRIKIKDRVSVLFEEYAKPPHHEVYEDSYSIRAYYHICKNVFKNNPLILEGIPNYEELSAHWQEYCSSALLLVAQENKPLAPYVDKGDDSNKLVTLELVERVLRNNAGPHGRDAVNHIKALFLNFIEDPDCPPLFVSDARFLTFMNIVGGLFKGERLSVYNFRLDQDGDDLERFGYCYPQFPADEHCAEAKPWQIFTDGAIQYFIETDQCKHIENIALLQWGGVTIKKPYLLIEYKSRRGIHQNLRDAIKGLQLSYQRYQQEAKPTPMQIHAQSLFLAALIKLLAKQRPVSYQKMLDYLHPVQSSALKTLEIVRDSSSFLDSASFWRTIVNPIFELCRQNNIPIDDKLELQLLPVDAQHAQCRQALLPLIDSARTRTSAGLEAARVYFMMLSTFDVQRPITINGFPWVHIDLAELMNDFLIKSPQWRPESRELPQISRLQIQAHSGCESALGANVPLPIAGGASMESEIAQVQEVFVRQTPEAGAIAGSASMGDESAQVQGAFPVNQRHSATDLIANESKFSKNFIELKAKMLEDIAALDIQADRLSAKNFHVPSEILRNLSDTLKQRVTELYKDPMNGAFLANFEKFKIACQDDCRAALQEDNAVLASHRGPRQAIHTFLQTISVLGALWGVVRKLCGKSYSAGIFKQNTRSEDTVIKLSGSLSAASAA